MTARERIDYLLDNKANSIEIVLFVGDGMYENMEVVHLEVLLLKWDMYQANNVSW